MRLLVDNPRYSRVALGLPGLLVLIFGVFWALDFVYQGAILYYGIAIIIILGGFLLLKGFGVDKSAKDFYKWAHEYTPPSLPMQISNYTIIAGILCVAVSVYLGIQSVNTNVASQLIDLGAWISLAPDITAAFIKGLMDLMVVGLSLVLAGRSVRLYFERDPKLLRSIALIVEVAWSRWILLGTANLLQNPWPMGFANNIFTEFIFAIVVGILIGIASILLITIIQRSSKEFFNKSDQKLDEL